MKERPGEPSCGTSERKFMQRITTRMLFPLVLVSLLVSCENSDTSTLVGTWMTESCVQGTSFDISGDYWERGVFRFSSGGKLKVGKNIYTDSSCQALDTEIPPGLLDDSTRISFEELGKDVRSKDKGARGLRIVITSGSLSIDVGGLYAIDSGRACFSETFTFHASGISIEQLGDAMQIDYEDCLVRYVE